MASDILSGLVIFFLILATSSHLSSNWLKKGDRVLTVVVKI